MAMRPGLLEKRIFKSGQVVPLDGIYGNLWGGWLPLIQGDVFPPHPAMGESKWTYRGALGSGLPEWKRADGKRRATER